VTVKELKKILETLDDNMHIGCFDTDEGIDKILVINKDPEIRYLRVYNYGYGLDRFCIREKETEDTKEKIKILFEAN
jgi:hypothetical protein